ncbi:MAG: DUF4338 domain-containing protein [Deltaproteobacteria bacterium]|nr:DUF4338 domain-containing protein [Deltaproteobacteria bacterium]
MSLLPRRLEKRLTRQGLFRHRQSGGHTRCPFALPTHLRLIPFQRFFSRKFFREKPKRKVFLDRLANYSRFFIFPWVQIPHLASHVLALTLRRLNQDCRENFTELYGF